jgi:hypothetical protein
MDQTVRLDPEFVENMPDELTPGKLYISTRYRTASHLCACGCGRKVITPIKPHRWRFTYDGEAVSLWPSIGRWQLPCRAHYWIRDNEIVWARAFSDEEMGAVQNRDARDQQRYYEERAIATQAFSSASAPQEREPEPQRSSVWRTIARRFRRK